MQFATTPKGLQRAAKYKAQAHRVIILTDDGQKKPTLIFEGVEDQSDFALAILRQIPVEELAKHRGKLDQLIRVLNVISEPTEQTSKDKA